MKGGGSIETNPLVLEDHMRDEILKPIVGSENMTLQNIYMNGFELKSIAEVNTNQTEIQVACDNSIIIRFWFRNYYYY